METKGYWNKLNDPIYNREIAELKGSGISLEKMLSSPIYPNTIYQGCESKLPRRVLGFYAASKMAYADLSIREAEEIYPYLFYKL